MVNAVGVSSALPAIWVGNGGRRKAVAKLHESEEVVDALLPFGVDELTVFVDPLLPRLLANLVGELVELINDVIEERLCKLVLQHSFMEAIRQGLVKVGIACFRKGGEVLLHKFAQVTLGDPVPEFLAARIGVQFLLLPDGVSDKLGFTTQLNYFGDLGGLLSLSKLRIFFR